MRLSALRMLVAALLSRMFRCSGVLLSSLLMVMGFAAGISYLFHGRFPNFSNIHVNDHRPAWAKNGEASGLNVAVDVRTKEGRALATVAEAKGAIELWAIVGALQVGFWFGAVTLTIYWCMQQREYWWPLQRGPAIGVLASVAVLLGFLGVLFGAFLVPWTKAGSAGAPIEWGVGFATAPAGLGPLGNVAILCAAVPVVFIGLAGSWLKQNHETVTLHALVRLRIVVQRLLLVDGIGLALATLGMAALTRARRANTLEAPIEYVWIHGVVHSLALGLAYAPTHAQLLEAANAVCDRVAPFPNLGDPELEQKVIRRRDLEPFVGLRSAGLGSLGAGLPVLFPVFTSFISTILGPVS